MVVLWERIATELDLLSDQIRDLVNSLANVPPAELEHKLLEIQKTVDRLRLLGQIRAKKLQEPTTYTDENLADWLRKLEEKKAALATTLDGAIQLLAHHREINQRLLEIIDTSLIYNAHGGLQNKEWPGKSHWRI